MKKLLLLSISAMMSLGAMAQVTEPTLTEVFKYTESIPATRYITGYNGKIYLMTDSKVYSYDKDNAKVEYASTAYNVISVDEAGNLIANNGLYGNGAIMWCIISAKDQSVINIEIPVPNGTTKGNVHQVGEVVGDVLSEDGGYLTFAYNGETKAVVTKIANGAVVESYVSDAIDLAVGPKFSNAGKTVPVFTTIEEYVSAENPANSVYWRNRSEGNIYMITTEGTTKKFPAPATAQFNGEGFDVFTLGDVTYALYPLKSATAAKYGDGFLVAELEKGKVVASQELSFSTATYYSSLVAEKVSDTKANIYVWNAGTTAAMYTFEVPAAEDVDTAIESVEVAAGAVEYYNLQGVKVANPENGLFIKKQGNKVSKVIL